MRSCDHGSSQTSLTSTSATPSTAATASATVRGIAPAGCCYVGAGVPLVNRLATLLSDDLDALCCRSRMWISTWTGRGDVDTPVALSPVRPLQPECVLHHGYETSGCIVHAAKFWSALT